jgi:hypothetical protein
MRVYGWSTRIPATVYDSQAGIFANALQGSTTIKYADVPYWLIAIDAYSPCCRCEVLAIMAMPSALRSNRDPNAADLDDVHTIISNQSHVHAIGMRATLIWSMCIVASMVDAIGPVLFALEDKVDRIAKHNVTKFRKADHRYCHAVLLDKKFICRTIFSVGLTRSIVDFVFVC